MQKTTIQPVKGTRDFYPEQMRFRSWLFGKMRKVSQTFGFEEYEGAIIEPVELYLGKTSEEIIKNQAFTFKDRSGKTIALRPEMTPTLARMVAQKQNQLNFPIRWFTIGPRFRYEQPQKGREREFYQWDCDLLGIDSPEADSEIIAVAINFFKELGFSAKEIVLKINSRKLMDFKLSLLELSAEKKKAVIKAIDRKDKMDQEKWLSYIKEIGLSELQILDLEKILKDTDYKIESPELTEVFSTLSDLGIAEYVEYDPKVVRGLDYYTGTVFEVRDRKGEFRAILGGGRYGNLVENFSAQGGSASGRGGNKISGVGFATSDVILEELLKTYQKLPQFPKVNTLILVTIFDESLYRTSLKTAKKLRDAGLSAEFYLSTDRLDKQLKYADKKGIRYAVIIGPEEEKQGKITVKDLVKRDQSTVTVEKFIENLPNDK